MTGLFMFILFFMNIMTIFVVIVLFMRQNRLIQVEKDQRSIVSEMEELMTNYLMEMKEENEVFLEKVADKNQNHLDPQQSNASDFNEIKRDTYLTKNKALMAYKNQSSIEADLEKDSGSTEQNDHVELSIVRTEQDIETDDLPKKESFSETLHASLNGQSVPEPSFNEQVKALSAKGLSVEEIAKNLKRGKTEIELLLKFQSGK